LTGSRQRGGAELGSFYSRGGDDLSQKKGKEAHYGRARN